MALHLILSDGIALPFHAGLPASFRGTRWLHATATHSDSSHGSIMLQELTDSNITLRHQTIAWRSPSRLRYEYRVDGLHIRIAIRGRLHDRIKGAGELVTHPGHYTFLLARSWTGLLHPLPGQIIELIEIICPLKGLPAFSSTLQQLTPVSERIPFLPDQPPRLLEAKTAKLSDQMVHAPITGTERVEHAGRFVSAAMHDIDTRPLTHGVSEEDLARIYRARDLIAANLDKHFTIPQLTRMIGMNEYKLKALFPRLIGRAPFEYMMYLRCLRARDQILSSSHPIKHFFKAAGYSSLASFITGFRKMLQCTPGELRRRQWSKDEVKPH